MSRRISRRSRAAPARSRRPSGGGLFGATLDETGNGPPGDDDNKVAHVPRLLRELLLPR